MVSAAKADIDADNPALRRELQNLARLPAQDEFVQLPGAVRDIVGQEQGQCMAEAYNLSLPTTKININNSTRMTQLSISDESQILLISTDYYTGVSISRCPCNADGDYDAFAIKRSTISVVSAEARITASTYISTDIPGTHLSLLVTLAPPLALYGRTYTGYNLKASGIADASLGHASETLLQSGAITASALGGDPRSVSEEERTWIVSVLRHALSAAVQCHIINYSGG
jgi:hypothetical protein